MTVFRGELVNLSSFYYQKRTREEYEELRRLIDPVLEQYGYHLLTEVEIPKALEEVYNKNRDKVKQYYPKPLSRKK